MHFYKCFQHVLKKYTLIMMIRDNQFAKFLVVGLVNTIVGYSIFSFFIFINLHYALASLLATLLGILFNFKTTGVLVFKNRDNSLIARFFLVYAVVYILNIISLKFFNDLNINMYLSGAILMVPLAVLSFILNKKFVFGVIR